MVRTKRSSHPRGRCMWVGAGHTPVVAVLSCVCKSPTSASLPPKGEDRGPLGSSSLQIGGFMVASDRPTTPAPGISLRGAPGLQR
jgi:hypothetical protein